MATLSSIKDTETQTENEVQDQDTQTVSDEWLARQIKESERKWSALGNVRPRTYFRFSLFEAVPGDFEYLTGISLEHFEVFLNFLGGERKCGRLKYRRDQLSPVKDPSTNLSVRDKLFLTLVLLRRGFTERDLGIMFGLSQGFVSSILMTWLQFMYLEISEVKEYLFLPVQKNSRKIPHCFRPFKNLRVILDCLEVAIQSPTNFQQQGNTYSQYKSRNTVKFLVGISVYGSISYISEAFEGSISDKAIFTESDITKFLNEGETIMADRGFTIREEVDSLKLHLVIPPFLGVRGKLSKAEVQLTKDIARARVHVERAINRIKAFRIFAKTLPVTLLPMVSQISKIVAFLVNFQSPIVI